MRPDTRWRKKERRPSIWESKRGGIPAINEIVMTFLNVTPKPILFAIFIVLISIIGTFLMPTVLNLFGYACVTDAGSIELYQVPMNKLAEKSFSDASKSVRTWFGLEDYKFPEDPFPNGDKRYLRIPHQCIVNQNINGSVITGYTSVCTNCSVSTNWWSATFFWQDSDVVCLSDGYYKPVPSGAVWMRNYCYQCSPPDPYYFNITNCQSESECYYTITHESLVGDVKSTYDYYKDRIVQLGGIKKAQDDTQFFNIQCKDVDQPTLYFFNIEIFNRDLWLIIIIGQFFVTFAFMWYRQIH